MVKICDFGLARDIYKDPDYVRKGDVSFKDEPSVYYVTEFKHLLASFRTCVQEQRTCVQIFATLGSDSLSSTLLGTPAFEMDGPGNNF